MPRPYAVLTEIMRKDMCWEKGTWKINREDQGGEKRESKGRQPKHRCLNLHQ